jgi:hypothetical protein
VQKEITYQGRTLEIVFGYHNQGTRVWVNEWKDEKWIHRIDGILHILETEFEILCDIAAELFGDTIHAESLAELLGVPYRFSDDAQCRICETWQHYEEGKYDSKNDSYLCSWCMEEGKE